jgi:cytidine deaminase
VLYPPEKRVLDAALGQPELLTGDPSHTVAAAAMDTTGRIFAAVNDYHFTGGPCAELVVLGVPTAAGAGPLTTMVAVGDRDRGVIPQCGRCRQVLLDQQPGCQVIAPIVSAEPDLVPVRRLLPYSYNFPDAHPERFIRFNPRYYDSVAAGQKTATTRIDDPCMLGPAWLVFEFDDEYMRLLGVVDFIDTKRFDEITDGDAQLEGGAVADDLRNGLRSHYPGIRDDSTVDVCALSSRTLRGLTLASNRPPASHRLGLRADPTEAVLVPPARYSVVPAAYVYLIADDQVLLQRRRNTGYMDGMWVAGAAGHIEPGETAAVAAVREAREELGIQLSILNLLPATVMQRTAAPIHPVNSARTGASRPPIGPVSPRSWSPTNAQKSLGSRYSRYPN